VRASVRSCAEPVEPEPGPHHAASPPAVQVLHAPAVLPAQGVHDVQAVWPAVTGPREPGSAGVLALDPDVLGVDGHSDSPAGMAGYKTWCRI
jgi:hypothetical protein